MTDKKNNPVRTLAPYMTMGLEIAIYIIVFTFIGYWIDNKFNTLPLFTVILSLLGIAGGLYKFIKNASKFNNKKNKQS